MPAGYEFTYSESSRRSFDTWIRNLTMIALGAIAVTGSFWAIKKRNSSAKAGRSKSLYEFVETDEETNPTADNAPFKTGDGPGTPLPGEPGAIPAGSLEWNSSSIFNSPESANQDEDDLWNATGTSDEPLAPSSANDFRDPAIPSFDNFQ